MIFAEFDYPEHYSEFHNRLARHLQATCQHVESGLQGDSWFWVLDGGQKVELDTFYSMKHQLKSAQDGPHVRRLIASLEREFTLRVYAQPGLEPHEGG